LADSIQLSAVVEEGYPQPKADYRSTFLMAEDPRLFTCQVKSPQLHGLNTQVAQLGVDGGTRGGTNVFSKKKMSVCKGFKDLLESRHAIYS
jgi:hypothetical protein